MDIKTPHLSNALPPSVLKELVQQWLKEDIPSLDCGGFVVGDIQETAVILCKGPGVLAGLPFVDAIFKELSCEVTWLVKEGDYVLPICEIAHVSGSVRNILLGERLALNCLSRISGVATLSRRLKQVADGAGWHGQIAGTRKTTPGFRIAEKYGLLVGGVATHRFDLSSMVMLKDNHVWSTGNITDTVKTARRVTGVYMKIEVECRSVLEALEALGAGAEIIMLDNFEPKALHKAAAEVKGRYPLAIIEASGGINEDNLHQYLGPNIDVTSMSILTQGYRTVDFSLKIIKKGYTASRLGSHTFLLGRVVCRQSYI